MEVIMEEDAEGRTKKAEERRGGKMVIAGLKSSMSRIRGGGGASTSGAKEKSKIQETERTRKGEVNDGTREKRKEEEMKQAKMVVQTTQVASKGNKGIEKNSDAASQSNLLDGDNDDDDDDDNYDDNDNDQQQDRKEEGRTQISTKNEENEHLLPDEAELIFAARQLSISKASPRSCSGHEIEHGQVREPAGVSMITNGQELEDINEEIVSNVFQSREAEEAPLTSAHS